MFILMESQKLNITIYIDIVLYKAKELSNEASTSKKGIKPKSEETKKDLKTLPSNEENGSSYSSIFQESDLEGIDSQVEDDNKENDVNIHKNVTVRYCKSKKGNKFLPIRKGKL